MRKAVTCYEEKTKSKSYVLKVYSKKSKYYKPTKNVNVKYDIFAEFTYKKMSKIIC